MSDLPRRSVRFPAQVETVAIIARLKARVVDESQSGLALAVVGPLALSVGQVVEIDYDGSLMKAIVRRIAEQVDGSHVVGMQWK